MIKMGRLAINITLMVAALIMAQIAGAVTMNEFPVPTANSTPFRITLGPDGNLWFTEYSGNKIGRITTGGVITEFSVPTANSQPLVIIAGPDGNLWFTEQNGNKDRTDFPSGVILNEFLVPTANSQPTAIAIGPDGNLWFTEYSGNKIGRITTGGVITEFLIPTANSQPSSIRIGPDGNLWFTENNGNKIGQISLAGVILNEFSIPTSNSQPSGIHNGPDGNLWFCEQDGNRIGKITTAGVITEFLLPFANSKPRAIRTGLDGNLWFTVYGTNGNKIDQITIGGVITEFTIPTPTSNPGNIAIGPDGNLWFTEQSGNKIGQVILNATPMPVPAGQIWAETPPVMLPIINPVPNQAAPIGLGLVASGNLFSIEIGLGQFSAPVDIYFAIFAPAISPGLLILTPTGLLSSNLEPWVPSTLGNIFVLLLQDIPLSALPTGTYTFYLAVTPAGSISNWYIWQTSFTRP